MTASVGVDISENGQIVMVPPAGSEPTKIDSSGPRPRTTNPFAPLLSHLERGRPLPEGWEARDILLDIIEEDGYCVAAFGFGSVRLPAELAPRLRILISKKVGILHLNGYRIRNLMG